jgi:tetratricopeptide (TPR) repeat protein
MTVSECDHMRQQIDQLRAVGGELLADGTVLEALGKAYAEIGQYEEAIAAYGACLDHESAQARLKVVEQLANFKVRLATRLARESGHPTSRSERLFDEATNHLRELTSIAGHTSERSALRGSLHKKRATVLADRTEKVAEIGRARDAYHEAFKASVGKSKSKPLNSYHTNLWLQMAALARDRSRVPASERERLRELLDQVRKAASNGHNVRPDDDGRTYWDVAELADTLVTQAVLTRDLKEAGTALEEAAKNYRTAFGLRSTVRERDSSLDHLSDLIELVPQLSEPLTNLRTELLKHQGDGVSAAS